MKVKRDVDFYLKRMAALQFSNCVDNYKIRTPIHLLQERTDELMQIDLDEAAYYLRQGEKLQFYDRAFEAWYATLEELVLGRGNVFLPLNVCEEKIQEYNACQEKAGKVPFWTWKQVCEADGAIPNCDGRLFCSAYNQINTEAVQEYLMLYGVDCEDLQAYRYGDAYEIRAVGFTHKGICEVEKDRANHLFRDTRTYAWNDENEEFSSIMQHLLKEGQELLQKELKGYSIDWDNPPLTPGEINEKIADIHDDGSLQICSFAIRKGKLMKAHFRVVLDEFKKYEDKSKSFWTRNAYVVAAFCDGKTEKIKYPFDDDKYCEKVQTTEGALKLFAYASYQRQ